MKKPFFFRVDAGELLNFATNPEGENMTLFQFAKELMRGSSSVEFIAGIIEESHSYIEKKRTAGRSGGKASLKHRLNNAQAPLKPEAVAVAVAEAVTTKQKKKPLVGLAPDPAVIEVIEYLNGKTGAAFRPGTKATAKHITARIKEGATVDDLLDVIDLKCEQWIGDPKMSGYLRPETLFNAEKFQSYSAEVSRGPVVPKSKSIYADGLVL